MPSAFGLSDEVAFVSGVYPNGTLPFYAFGAWNSDNPATYTGGYTNSVKWGAPTADTPGGTIDYYFDPSSLWNSTEQQFLTAGLALWSDIANISFALTTNPAQAQITFTRGNDREANTSWHATGTAGAGVTGGTNLFTMTSATVSIDTSVVGFGPIDGTFTTYGGYPVMTLLHEEGHAIGLGHAGPYNNTVDVATQQFSAYDTRLWTIMSYVEPRTTTAEYYSQYPVTGTDWGLGPAGYHNDPTTWMPLDILAAQALYGLPTSTPLSGGQTFGFNSNVSGLSAPFFDFTKNVDPVVTLWDMGTNNTLDLTGFSASSTVNLTPGTFSSCNGQINNIAIAFNTAIDTVICGSGNDTVTANNDGDTLNGGAGSDTLIGGTGNDTINGGPGSDTLDGGSGTDLLTYAGAASGVTVSLAVSGPQDTHGAGIDTISNFENLTGSSFNDALTGDDNANVIRGNAGADVINAGNGNDEIHGGAGNDELHGQTGNDIIYGGTGDDTIWGGQGSDVLDGGGEITAGDNPADVGNDTLNGATPLAISGTDDTAGYLSAGGGVTVSLALTGAQNTVHAGWDTLNNINNVIGSTFDDTLYGNSGNNVLSGGQGNDELHGGQGSDTLFGGSGNDTIYGGAGNDAIIGGAGDDLLWGGGANSIAGEIDTFYFSDGAGDTVTVLNHHWADFGVGNIITTPVLVDQHLNSAETGYHVT